jgi:transcriptional regulator with XRE-family HTH domain
MTSAPAPRGGYDYTEADRIKKARSEADKMSQDELADLADISRATISNYENGHKVKASNRRLMAMALGVSVKWLETGQLTELDGDGITSADPNVSSGYRIRRVHRDRITPGWGVGLRHAA